MSFERITLRTLRVSPYTGRRIDISEWPLITADRAGKSLLSQISGDEKRQRNEVDDTAQAGSIIHFVVTDESTVRGSAASQSKSNAPVGRRDSDGSAFCVSSWL